MPDVIAICGSLRKKSLNRLLMRAAIRELEALKLSVEEVGIDAPLYNGDVEESSGAPPAIAAAKAKLASAPGLLVVSPEYNGSIPGPLKNFIDWCSRGPGNVFEGRVICVCTASPGAYGGVRSTIALKSSLTHLDAWIVPGAVNVPKADAAFDDQGALKEPRVQKALASKMALFAQGISRLR